MKTALLQWLIARTRAPLAGRFIGYLCEHLRLLLPVEILYENEWLMVFKHPQPAYELHLLILPKKAIYDFSEVSATSPVWTLLPETVHHLVSTFHLPANGYRLITNVGVYQDIHQLHFHFVSGNPL